MAKKKSDPKPDATVIDNIDARKTQEDEIVEKELPTPEQVDAVERTMDRVVAHQKEEEKARVEKDITDLRPEPIAVESAAPDQTYRENPDPVAHAAVRDLIRMDGGVQPHDPRTGRRKPLRNDPVG